MLSPEFERDPTQSRASPAVQRLNILSAAPNCGTTVADRGACGGPHCTQLPRDTHEEASRYREAPTQRHRAHPPQLAITGLGIRARHRRDSLTHSDGACDPTARRSQPRLALPCCPIRRAAPPTLVSARRSPAVAPPLPRFACLPAFHAAHLVPHAHSPLAPRVGPLSFRVPFRRSTPSDALLLRSPHPARQGPLCPAPSPHVPPAAVTATRLHCARCSCHTQCVLATSNEDRLARPLRATCSLYSPLDVPYGHPSLRVHLFRRSCFLLSSLLPPSFSHAPHFLLSPLLPPRPPGLGGQEALYGREVRVADREMVESRAGDLLHLAAKEDVAFLVVGDPFGCVPRTGAAMCPLRQARIVHQGQGAARAGTFLHKRVELRGGCKALPVGKWSAGPLEPCATTHTDLMLRARQQGVAVSVVHNASVLNAVGATGLQLYRFGETVSIPFFTDTWQPDSFYDRILGNAARDLHTLCLLDIKVKEPSLEAMARGRIEYEAPRYMSVNTAICQLLLVEEKRHQQVCTPDSLCVGVARLGADSQCIVFGSMQQLSDVDLGPPLHSLVLCGALHELERDFLDAFKVTDATPRIVEGSEGSEEEESERPIL
ncbi:unnamed protein product [Closterium sp. Naga37s-1]|nr:unnamed protein product [Closterium sp. Naga37s-1]